MRHILSYILSSIIYVMGVSHAADLGVRGTVFEIAEPDMIDSIIADLRAAEADGRLDALNAQMLANARKPFFDPIAVAGIMPALTAETRVFDPSITITRDITLPDGRLLAGAGTRINPLAYARLRNDLWFIDGRDAAQLELALAQSGQPTIILVAGAPKPLMDRYLRVLYYDQQGVLSRRFGIVRVPSRISQAGDRLQIDEIPTAKGGAL